MGYDGGEDVVVLHEDVVGGESNELAATQKHMAEEVEGVEGVGEVGKDSNLIGSKVGLEGGD